MPNNIIDKNINLIKQQIKKAKTSELEIDLSSMNVLEASKVAVLSSAIHYSKYPEGKIKCKLQSDNIKNFISGLSIPNLEFIS